MDELMKMGKGAGIKKLAEHEQAGTLREYIKKVAPQFIHEGEVHKFRLLAALGWQ